LQKFGIEQSLPTSLSQSVLDTTSTTTSTTHAAPEHQTKEYLESLHKLQSEITRLNAINKDQLGQNSHLIHELSQTTKDKDALQERVS